jgi:hypothetical protein
VIRLANLIECFSSETMWWAGFLSLGVIVVGVALLPAILLKLPSDYVSAQKTDRGTRFTKRTFLGQLYWVGRNLLGGLLVLLGIVLLVAPGQGLVSIVAGLAIMDFPHKHTLLKRMVGQKHVLRSINRLRVKCNRPPLRMPE